MARGPKPARALRELGLLPTIAVEQPTTEGVIDALQSRTWQGARVGVQLCGEKPNLKLFQFLKAAGATAQGVAPYVYAPASGDDKIAQLIRHMSMGEVDAVAFTCSAQVDRLFAVAKIAQYGRHAPPRLAPHPGSRTRPGGGGSPARSRLPGRHHPRPIFLHAVPRERDRDQLEEIKVVARASGPTGEFR